MPCGASILFISDVLLFSSNESFYTSRASSSCVVRITRFSQEYHTFVLRSNPDTRGTTLFCTRSLQIIKYTADMFIQAFIAMFAIAAASVNAAAVPKATASEIIKRNQYNPRKAATRRNFLPDPVIDDPPPAVGSGTGCNSFLRDLCALSAQECVNGACQVCNANQGFVFNSLSQMCEQLPQLVCVPFVCEGFGGSCQSNGLGGSECACPTGQSFNTAGQCVETCPSVNVGLSISQSPSGNCQIDEGGSCSVTTGYPCATGTTCQSATLGGSLFCLAQGGII